MRIPGENGRRESQPRRRTGVRPIAIENSDRVDLHRRAWQSGDADHRARRRILWKVARVNAVERGAVADVFQVDVRVDDMVERQAGGLDDSP